ncbi:MAG TPA: hypothetical protein VFG58_00720 [Solirubrobacterales bacterium]|nr:hypothetical protein [Solirubrobacterales bacterium]
MSRPDLTPGEVDHPLQALTTVLRGSAVPYGYTLTVLSSHSIVSHSHGPPSVFDILLFVVGAIAAFAMLGLLAERLAPEPLELGHADMIRAGVIHVVAIGLAFGAATLIALIPGVAAWPLASFAATTLYLFVASLEIVFARRLEHGK